MPIFFFHLTNGVLVEDFGGESFDLRRAATLFGLRRSWAAAIRHCSVDR